MKSFFLRHFSSVCRWITVTLSPWDGFRSQSYGRLMWPRNLIAFEDWESASCTRFGKEVHSNHQPLDPQSYNKILGNQLHGITSHDPGLLLPTNSSCTTTYFAYNTTLKMLSSECYIQIGGLEIPITQCEFTVKNCGGNSAECGIVEYSIR